MIVQNANLNKLHTELDGAGVNVIYALNTDSEGKVRFIFADGTDMDLVQQIIDAHDPTPIPPEPSMEEKLRLEMARSNSEMFETMLSLLGGM